MKERFNKVYDYLRSHGLVHSQKDLADKIGAYQSNISSALKGDTSYLTRNLMLRVNAAFNNMFNSDWLVSGTGDMLADHFVREMQAETGIDTTTLLERSIVQNRKLIDLCYRQYEALERKDAIIEKLLKEHDEGKRL